MCDGDIVENEPELLGPCHQVLPHGVAEHLPVGDELPGVKLSHHGLEDLVGDAGQHPLVVVHTQGGVNVG